MKEELCFCEYDDVSGQKSHMLTTCCDCEALDSACDRCISCQKIPNETMQKLFLTVNDRCRVPWIGGAKKMDFSRVLPLSLVPCSVLLATLGPIWTILSLSGMCCCVFFCSRAWIRQTGKKKTPVFLIFTLTSLCQMYLTYITVVVGFREVFLWETMLLTTLFAATMFFLFRTRQTLSGNVVSSGEDVHKWSRNTMSREQEISVFSESEVTWIDSRPIINGRLETWCSYCKLHQPPRSSHCTLCEVCILGRDHHCVWIDVCIGNGNHRDFLTTLALFIVTGLYGAHLTMTTVCTPEMYLDWFLLPNDCRFAYSDFPTALSFVSVFCVYIGVVFVSFVLLQQLILITQNVTLVEARRAAARGWSSVSWLPCVVSSRHNVNNRGACNNWVDFINGSRRQKYLAFTSSV